MDKLLKLFSFIKPTSLPGTGALLDERTVEAKQKDYVLKEIVSTPEPVIWTEKPQSEWRKFPIFNQDGSGSCVAQTMAKLLGILYWLKNGIYVHFSATHIYQRRANKPQPGMGGVDALEIGRKGVTLEVLTPSQAMTDSQMDSAVVELYKVQVGEVFKSGNYVTLPEKDIETAASTIQTTKKGAMVWFYFKYSEWTNVPVLSDPNLAPDSPDIVRHSVTAVDFTLYQGKKALIVEDSWGPQYGFGGQRVITEDFYKTRNFFCAYPISFVFEEGTVKPKYTFAKTLLFNMTDPDVKGLQDILKYEGFFPTNTESTGYYGAITAKGVLAWQKAHNVAPASELDVLQGRSIGPKTITALNAIYAS